MFSENKPLVTNQSGAIFSLLQDANGLLVKQTPKGWLKEMFCCDAQSEYKIARMEWNYIQDNVPHQINQMGLAQPDIMYALEESNACLRCCCKGGRPLEINVSSGGEAGGTDLAKFTKPCSFPLKFVVPLGENGAAEFPCCCFLPNLSTKLNSEGGGGYIQGNGDAEITGASNYRCNICNIPTLDYSEGGQPVYVLKPETCCGGMCIACNFSNCKGIAYIPFYFHDPLTMQVIGGEYGGANTPQIRKMWTGLARECCTTADTFAVMFPPGIDPARKANLLGLTFLLDFTVFEGHQ
mmetsp:Transcript_4990/g.12150  ORF Transcript_4990/g.12150 Transcript_4990/m.12150 type:complete len:295 (-) Transcript_4990:194-1078(-)